MGKRKERRRIAASAGRRVKLDLFAEPSGDLGGSSAQDEVGRDDCSKNHAGLPNSTTSSDPVGLCPNDSLNKSPVLLCLVARRQRRFGEFDTDKFFLGQQQENPLSLLGQYSDEDTDEESINVVNHTLIDSSSADVGDQEAKVAVDKECEEFGITDSKDLAPLKIEQHDTENISASPKCLQKPAENGAAETDATDSSIPLNETALVDQISVREPSNTQENRDVGSGWKMVLHEESDQYYYWNTFTGETSWDVPDVLAPRTELTFDSINAADVEGTENAVVGIHKSSSTLGVKMEGAVAVQPTDGSSAADPNCKTEEILEIRPNMEVPNDGGGAVPCDSSSPVNLGSSTRLDDALLGNGISTGADSEKFIHTSRHGQHETDEDLCSRLLSHGEYLLERLNTMKGSKGRLIGHDKISKYTAEVEVRLFDIKSLSSYASSMLPFWLHSERQFKQLESAISDEVLQFYESVEMGGTEAIEKKEVSSTPEHSHCGSQAEEVLKESNNDADNNHIVHHEEDVDMDVEMELEDAIPASSQYYIPPTQLPIWPNPPPEHDSFVLAEGVSVPPPPDDDWIPPPPPDDEPFPPPPPDEPPEPSQPPPPQDSVVAPSFSYAAQYGPTYPGSNFEYYGQTNAEVTESNFHAANPSQLTIPVPSYYYEAVPNTYHAAAPVVINPVEPLPYYELQDEAVPPVPGVSGVESSSLHCASGVQSLGSDDIRSDFPSLPNAGVDDFGVDGETEKKSSEVSVAPVYDQPPSTISLTQGISMSSTPVVTVAVTETAPKVQSKVPRNKKRSAAVVSIRSNKKVSSLVDKWKAAKEELHEDEEDDEPENAYEILEKKKRREIEEWHARQIAGGEAKDNANFQPLGGDWRERVKRKRARSVRKSEQALLAGTTDGHQQPDLVEISRDLPSGWQAHWDESSKQVYYGNSVTSETMWIRPTI